MTKLELINPETKQVFTAPNLLTARVLIMNGWKLVRREAQIQPKTAEAAKKP